MLLAEHERVLPRLAAVRDGLDATVDPVRVPADCVDGFLGANWRRPAAHAEMLRSACTSFTSAFRRFSADTGR